MSRKRKNLPSTDFFSGDEMQKGLATLEIILATMIIAILASSAVPNAARLIDSVSLDYETKRLYSELRFIQEMSRSTTISDIGTGGTGIITDTGAEPTLIIYPDKNYYQVFRAADENNPIREPHYLSKGIKISSPKNKISFNSDGKADINSNHITLTSRFGKNKYLIFDSVGRIRASLTLPNE